MRQNRPDTVVASAERKRLKREYAALFEDLTALLLRLDPMGLNFEVNPDEYEPEVGTILPRVFEFESPSEIEPVIREEFDRWFGGGMAIEDATYRELAEEVLVVLDRYRTSDV
jgi:hypothetical protein